MTIRIKVCLTAVSMLVSVTPIIVSVASAQVQTGDKTPAEVRVPKTPAEQGSDRQLKLAELRKQIAGQERKPSGEVFKNIKNFSNLPAGQLPLVMNAFSRALGVGCEHCHVSDKWESEEKPQKQIAREMMKLAGTINDSLLKDIKDLQSAQPQVSCSTCHRGQIIPDTKLPAN